METVNRRRICFVAKLGLCTVTAVTTRPQLDKKLLNCAALELFAVVK